MTESRRRQAVRGKAKTCAKFDEVESPRHRFGPERPWIRGEDSPHGFQIVSAETSLKPGRQAGEQAGDQWFARNRLATCAFTRLQKSGGRSPNQSPAFINAWTLRAVAWRAAMVISYGPRSGEGQMGQCIKPGRGATKLAMAPNAAAMMRRNSIMACGPQQARERPAG